MGIIEQIEKMKHEGYNEGEINDMLKEKGANPQEINDALNQIKIKKAVSSEEDYGGSEEMYSPHPQTSSGFQIPSPQGASSFYTPKTQEIEGSETESEFSAPQQREYSQEEYYPQENFNYQEYDTGSSTGGLDTETMIEVAQQVFEEKMKKIERQISHLNEFAALAETKISNNHDKLKRIESILDKLQIAILEKISSYGQDVNSIKKEMEMMQNVFSKTLPDLTEHHKKHKK